MPIISISRGSYHRGREVAHAVAEVLRYECISRGSLLQNSEIYDLPEIRLMPNVRHAAQVLERFSFGRDRYINYMSSSILRFLKKDNHVYHGLAGQFFVDGVSHVIKVRIIADLDERVAAEAKRKTISREEAREQLLKDDEERRKWAMLLYGVDISEPANYDMVLNISTMGVEDAASLIARSTSFPCYQATEDSTRRIVDLALQAEVKAALFDYPQAAVYVENGSVRIQVKVPESQEKVVRERMDSMLHELEGVASIDISFSPYY
ncbi:cytidylate kinase-like family protein [Desulfopila aestuarii]|uniref:Cytidylate kinase n=1 Tax=Desulfopila aestuarii DSM 18488 TaxID=1121416 RepID=A0A1M7YAB1_9BACT|nr:cytidylate kinase-like family protein [Desulfopila aestuarii]SHO49572.1 Cytidylate kinase [Desulfopila aestuarii DSM 18488]